VIEEAEIAAEVLQMLQALKLTVERLEKIRANQHKRIPDVMARRCEKYLKKPRGWLDDNRVEKRYCEPMSPDLRNLVDIYVRLSEKDRAKLYKMGCILLGESEPSSAIT
jgi:hypothetical protein